jgi:hypothetical protein
MGFGKLCIDDYRVKDYRITRMNNSYITPRKDFEDFDDHINNSSPMVLENASDIQSSFYNNDI